jgi:hypothetical protein
MSAYALTKFDVSEALSVGWQAVKENFMTLFIAVIIYMLASQVPAYILGSLAEQGSTLSLLLMVVIQVWNAYLMLGLTRYMLAFIRGQKPEYAVLFNNTDKFGNFIIMYLRYGLVILGGTLLFILPGIYFAMKYAYVLFLVADGKSDGSEAFKMSAKMTEGRKLNMFLFGIVGGVLVLLGFMLLILPGLIAAGVVSVGSYLMYDYALNHTNTKEEAKS